MSKKAGLFLVAFLFLFAAIASAAPPAKLFIPDENFPVYVADPDENVQSGASVCKDSSGNVVVAWLEDDDVYVQKIDTDGNRLWGDDGKVALTGTYTAVRVACCGDYVLIAAINDANEIILQRLDADGNTQWDGPPKKIAGTDADMGDDAFEICCDGAGGLFIAWGVGAKEQVKARRIDIDTGNFSYEEKVILDNDGAEVGNGNIDDAATLSGIGIAPTGAGGVWVVGWYDTPIADGINSPDTCWVTRAVGTGGELEPAAGSDPYTIFSDDNDAAETEKLIVFSDGDSGVVCVGLWTDGTHNYVTIDGLTKNAQDYAQNDIAQNGNVDLYDACYMSASDELAVLWTDNNTGNDAYKLQRYTIDHENKKFTAVWENPFDVDAAEVTHGDLTISLNSDDDGETAKIADLGGGYVGYSWIDGGAGTANHDLFAMVVDPDGNAVFNDADTPIVIEAGEADAITENVAMLAGSAFCIANFDPAAENEEATYKVGHFDWQLLPDLRWTAPVNCTDGLDTDEATSTLTVNKGKIENAGQADATDVVVSFYLMRNDDVNVTNAEWTAADAVKIKVGEVNIGNLGAGNEYNFSAPGKSYDIVISQEDLHAALQELGTIANETKPDKYCLIGFVNEGEVIDEGGANGYYEVSNQNADKNIEACLINERNIHAPDLMPNGTDEDVPDVSAGQTVTLDEVKIKNQGDRDGTSVSFYLWPWPQVSPKDPEDIDDLKEHGTFLGKVEDVTVESGQIVTLDPVELTIPATTGTGDYVIYVVPDADEEIGEFSAYANDPEDNNLNTKEGVGKTNKFTVTGLPDLALTFFAVSPATRTVCVEPGGLVDIQWVVKNMGSAATPATEMRYYLSTDATYDAGDIELEPASYVRGLESGDEEENTVIRRIPYDTACGFWYVIGRVVPVADEITEDNNVMSQQIAVKMGVDIAYTDGALSLTLNPCGYVGTNADWWLVAVTPFGTYWYNGVTWVAGYVTPGHQGPLFALTDYEVTLPTLPSGTYTFYFGVDLIPDGSVTYENLCFDSVTVTVP